MTRKSKVSWGDRNHLKSLQIHSDRFGYLAEWSLPSLMQVLIGLKRRPCGWQSRMFCGLRSLWRMPLPCRTFMAWAICCRNRRMVSSLNVPFAVSRRYETHGTWWAQTWRYTWCNSRPFKAFRECSTNTHMGPRFPQQQLKWGGWLYLIQFFLGGLYGSKDSGY